MRCFIAVPLPGKLKDPLNGCIFSLKGAGFDDFRHAAWVKPEGFHITLAFLGETQSSEIDAVETSLQSLSRIGTFDCGLSKPLVFPDRKRPRVLALSICDDSGGFKKLNEAVSEGLVRASNSIGRGGAIGEWRLDTAGQERKTGFVPHLTLARIKTQHVDPSAIQYFLETASFPQSNWRVDSCILYRSDLKPSGAVYTPLSEFPLDQDYKANRREI